MLRLLTRSAGLPRRRSSHRYSAGSKGSASINHRFWGHRKFIDAAGASSKAPAGTSVEHRFWRKRSAPAPASSPRRVLWMSDSCAAGPGRARSGPAVAAKLRPTGAKRAAAAPPHLFPRGATMASTTQRPPAPAPPHGHRIRDADRARRCPRRRWSWGAGFAGLYMLHKLRTLGFSRARDRGRRRCRRHLVLEPLPRRALRHRDHRLHLQLRPRTGDGLDLVGEVRHPARDPALCPASWPIATTCGATSTSTRGWISRALGRGAEPLADRAPDAARHSSPRFYVMATGCLSLPKDARHPGRRPLQGRGLLHQPLAARGRGLQRQAGGGDRHRLVGHPGRSR